MLPASQRFFAGGDQSVRGYAYQSLGPRDATGKVVGGKYLTTYSAETEYRVYGNWGAATFLDLGNAADNPSPHLFRGAGRQLPQRDQQAIGQAGHCVFPGLADINEQHRAFIGQALSQLAGRDLRDHDISIKAPYSTSTPVYPKVTQASPAR